MAAPRRRWAADLLHFWFHQLDPADWWRGDERVDAACRRFEREWRALRARPAEEFLDDPRTALASVLLFDQIPRNLHRGTPLAFASDPLARAITHEALRRSWHRRLRRDERQFLYMPLMHSEIVTDQLLSVALFARLGRSLGFARRHAAMIRRFGRFPHRNEVLGRTTTRAERRAIEAGFAW